MPNTTMDNLLKIKDDDEVVKKLLLKKIKISAIIIF